MSDLPFLLPLFDAFQRLVRRRRGPESDLPFVLPLFDAAIDPAKPNFRGTGLLVAPNYVLTSRHVVAEQDGHGGYFDELISSVVVQAVGRYIPGVELKADSARDLVLVRLEDRLDGVPGPPLLARLTQKSIERLRKRPLYACGYPEEYGGVRQHFYSLSSLKATGVYLPTGEIEDLQVEGGVGSGCSGGPALVRLPSGAWACFGIVRLGGSRSPTTRISPAKVVLEFLGSAEVRPKTLDARKVPSENWRRRTALAVIPLGLLGFGSYFACKWIFYDDPCAEKNLQLIQVKESDNNNNHPLAAYQPESPFPTDDPQKPQSPPSPKLVGCSLTVINRTGIPIRLWRFLPKRCDLQLMSSVNDVSGIPTAGNNLIIVAVVNHLLHFRMFDGEGEVAVDTDEKKLMEQARRLTEQAQQIEGLRKQLESLWPPHELTKSEEIQVFAAVTSITGYGEWRETIRCGPVEPPRLNAIGGWAYVLIENLQDSVEIARHPTGSPDGEKPPFVPNVYQKGWFYFPYARETIMEIKAQFFDDPLDPRNFVVTPL